MQRPKSPYEVLNVAPDAEPEVIDAAYKALMKKYHPDKMFGGPPLSASKAAELNDAFKILRDPARRARHDADEKARKAAMAGADRAFQANRRDASLTPRPAQRPPHPAPRPVQSLPRRRSTGSFIAGWAAIVAAVAAISLAYAATRQSQGQGLRAAISAAAEDVGEAAAGDRPAVSPRQVGDALVAFERVRALYGSSGVAAYSDACFDAQRRTRDLGDFDFCVAFDHAATALDSGTSEPVRWLFPNLDIGQLASRHSAAARLQPQDYKALEQRMADIQTLTYAAITNAERAEREAAGAQNNSGIPPPASARAAQPHQAPAARPRPPRAQPEPDLLQREGGIY